jgi:hypothetical protein
MRGSIEIPYVYVPAPSNRKPACMRPLIPALVKPAFRVASSPVSPTPSSTSLILSFLQAAHASHRNRLTTMTREKLWTALAKKLETKSLAARTRPSSHWTYSDKTQRSTLNLLQKRYRSMWTQQPGKQIGIAAERTKQWVEKYPRETAGIIACIVAAPLGIAAAHGLLYMVGFMAAGVAAGTFFDVVNISSTFWLTYLRIYRRCCTSRYRQRRSWKHFCSSSKRSSGRCWCCTR